MEKLTWMDRQTDTQTNGQTYTQVILHQSNAVNRNAQTGLLLKQLI